MTLKPHCPELEDRFVAAITTERQDCLALLALLKTFHDRVGDLEHEVATYRAGLKRMQALMEAMERQMPATDPQAQTLAPLTAYEGFPDGVSDSFCQHAVQARSQYNTTARALSAEVLRLRATLAERTRELETEKQYADSWERRSGDNYKTALTLANQKGQAEARLADAEGKLAAWHKWWQFVFNEGGPPFDLNDEALRAEICARWDAKEKTATRDAIQACIDAVNRERLSDPQPTEGDEAYDAAVVDCERAITALRDQAAPPKEER